MFSEFKTLREILTAKNLEGDDAIAQRAVIVILATFKLKKRAHHAGHLGASMDTDDVIFYASLALGGLDRTHQYAFLNDVKELKDQVRKLAAANGHVTVGTNEATALVAHAEAAYASIDAKVPVPAVIIEGINIPGILRGHHYTKLLERMPTAVNSNIDPRRPRLV